MKRKTLPLLLWLFLCIVCPGKLFAQLIVTDASELSGWTADSLVRNILLDEGVTISNAKFNGSEGVINCNSIGKFETGGIPTNIGMESGLILASGGVSVAIGPNYSDDENVLTTCEEYEDRDLASIASDVTNNVAALEFDFVPWDDMVTFSFVFGSEEYMEYVDSEYNDVFGFFVEGVNPDGGYYNHQNMALIPGTTEVVNINNVNLYHNSRYYVDNTGGLTIQFDGFTTLLEVSFGVVPMENYHIKMAICDVFDDMLDSGVFLKAHSFSTNLSYSMTIDDWIYTEIPASHYFCTNQGIEFNTVTNWNYDNVVWYFGDGTSAQGEQVTHTYDADGVYTVTNVLHNPHRATDSIFLTKEIEVRSLVSEEYATSCDSYTWHGTNYTESGTYDHIVHTTESCDSTLILHLTINPIDTTYLNITTCDEYEWYNTTYTQAGVYTHLEQSVNGCDSLLVLNLDLGDSYSFEDDVSACDSYIWRGTTYTESDTYTDFVQTPGACDSTFILHLTIGHEEIHPMEHETTCGNSFTWHGHHYSHNGIYYDTIRDAAGCEQIYSLDLTFVEGFNSSLTESVCDRYPWPSAAGGYLTESGHYLYEGQTQNGCDSIIDLKLTVHHAPAPIIAYVGDDYYKDGDTLAVITNTEFFSFQYDFFIEDEQGHFHEWDSCKWHISKHSWQLELNPAEYQDEPQRQYCRVYVAEHDNTPTELTCIIYNHYCEPFSITKRFYLKSSFFGVDDQETSRCAFDIIPNPNNGTMELRFENMKGKVEVKVYDMMGCLMDSFVTYNDKETKSIPYNLSDRKGIYFFVANGNEGSVTKKVVIR